jgi:hypothetical protein
MSDKISYSTDKISIEDIKPSTDLNIIKLFFILIEKKKEIEQLNANKNKIKTQINQLIQMLFNIKKQRKECIYQYSKLEKEIEAESFQYLPPDVLEFAKSCECKDITYYETIINLLQKRKLHLIKDQDKEITKSKHLTELLSIKSISAEDRPSGYASAEDMPSGYASAEDRPSGYAIAEDKPSGYATAEDKPSGYATAEDRPSGYAIAEDRPSGYAIAEDKPSGYAMAEDMPSGYATAEDKPSDYASAIISATTTAEAMPIDPTTAEDRLSIYTTISDPFDTTESGLEKLSLKKIELTDLFKISNANPSKHTPNIFKFITEDKELHTTEEYHEVADNFITIKPKEKKTRLVVYGRRNNSRGHTIITKFRVGIYTEGDAIKLLNCHTEQNHTLIPEQRYVLDQLKYFENEDSSNFSGFIHIWISGEKLNIDLVKDKYNSINVKGANFIVGSYDAKTFEGYYDHEKRFNGYYYTVAKK